MKGRETCVIDTLVLRMQNVLREVKLRKLALCLTDCVYD